MSYIKKEGSYQKREKRVPEIASARGRTTSSNQKKEK